VYARSSTFQARPEAIDEGIAYVRDEVMPAAPAMDGYVGLSMICDRESGRCIVTTSWSSEDAMSSSEQRVQTMRQRGAEIFGGAATVDRWEMAVLHRHAPAGDHAGVRCTWLSMDPGQINHTIETFRMTMIPAFEEMRGFCSASLMVDRALGRAVGSATFESREEMAASRSAVQALRMRMVGELGATVVDVAEFELALAHLHVPEMA
jgi:heme-degrading monooxygenase HmoA